MVFLWSILLFFKECDKKKLILTKEYFRILRIYYLRYNNFDRSVSSILKDIKNFIDFGPWKAPVNPEENQKHNLFNKIKLNQIEKYEELIWEIEDHKFNINGKDVGGVNIGYLVDFDMQDSIDILTLIKNKLYEIFPTDEEEFIIIQNILLYYGEYWHRISPWYYYNYQFDNWRKIIRDRDHENKHTRNVFKCFFNEFITYKGTIIDFLNEKRKKKINKEECDSLYKKLCWYNQYLSDKMWVQGNYIAISNDVDYNALPDFKSQDKYFNDLKIIYNTKGNLKGGAPNKLSDLLKL